MHTFSKEVVVELRKRMEDTLDLSLNCPHGNSAGRSIIFPRGCKLKLLGWAVIRVSSENG